MENAASALKMSFAVLIFIIALTITFSCVNKIKETSDFILKNIDKTNFYEKLPSSNLENINGGREVGIETIIANLYIVDKESFAIKVKAKTSSGALGGSTEYEFDLDNMSDSELEEKIIKFKEKYIGKNTRYIETFSEITYTGKYITAEDGTTLVETPGLKKIYITYEEI